MKETYEQKFIRLSAMCVTYFVAFDAMLDSKDEDTSSKLYKSCIEQRKEITNYIKKSM